MFSSFASAMWHKRKQEYHKVQDIPERMLRHNLCELFLDNVVSGSRLQTIAEDAVVAGCPGFDDLLSARHCKEIKELRGKHKKSQSSAKIRKRKNAHRDVMRRLSKRSLWPPAYIASITVFNTKTQEETKMNIAVSLPHEILWAFAQNNNKDDLLDQSGMTPTCKSHLLYMMNQFQKQEALAFGIWIDGCPCNWDRTCSLEAVTLNMPGLSGSNAGLRLPLCVLPKHYVAKDKTFDDILKVLSWSFVWAANGVFPPNRHDLSPWTSGDRWRKHKAGQTIGMSAFLCEIRVIG